MLVLLAALVLGTNGCSWFHKRKPQTVPQAQAPTVTEPPPAPTAAATTQPAEPEPLPAKPASQTTAPKPKPKPRPAARKKTVIPAEPESNTAAKPVQQASAAPPRIVLQEGGTNASANQISTAMPHDEATDRQRTTQQLLDATDANLRSLTRQLSADERSMVEQIKSYQQQAREAGKDGDLVRAHNLALKAHLLSDELVKR